MTNNIMDRICRKSIELYDGNEDKSRDWMLEPSDKFGGHSPFSFCKPLEGAEAVEKFLDKELRLKKHLSPERFRQRELCVLAKQVLKKSSVVKEWLQDNDLPYIKGKTPLDLVAKNAKLEGLIRIELHMAAMRKPYKPQNENFEERYERLSAIAGEIFGRRDVAQKWLRSETIKAFGGKSAVELMATDKGTCRIEQSLACIQYGTFA